MASIFLVYKKDNYKAECQLYLAYKYGICVICYFTATSLKEKNNGLAHVGSSTKDQTTVNAFLNTYSNGWP